MYVNENQQTAEKHHDVDRWERCLHALNLSDTEIWDIFPIDATHIIHHGFQSF